MTTDRRDTTTRSVFRTLKPFRYSSIQFSGTSFRKGSNESKYEKDPIIFTEYYYEKRGIPPLGTDYLDRILSVYGLKREEVEFLYDVIK